MIFPSWISRTRWAMWDTRASCVTTTIVFLNSWLRRRNRSRTSCPVFVSSSPVGSSAKRSGGSFARATPMATRCCSPPLNSSGRWLARCGMPTSSRSSFRRSARIEGLFPANRNGSSTFSSAVSVGTRLKNWKMKPTFARRYLTRSPSAKSTRLEPSTSIRPAVGRSIPPMRLSSVVFPHPDGPWTATSSPSATCMSRPRSAITSDFPVRYTLIRSFVRMFGTSATSELEDPRDIHARDANRDREGREEHRCGGEHQEEQCLRWEYEEQGDQGLPCASRARRNEGGRQVRREDADSRADDQARGLPTARPSGSDRRQLDVALERRSVQDDPEARGQDDDHECHLQFDETKE